MKPRTNPVRDQYLPRKIDRWRWMAGATAASAAAATASQAAVVQINLVGNGVSLSGTSLDADLTGGGANEITFSDTKLGVFKQSNAIYSAICAKVNVNQNLLSAGTFFSDDTGEFCTLKGATGIKIYTSGPWLTHKKGLYPITFTDAKFNGGAATNAFVEAAALPSPYNGPSVALTRLIFDDANPTSTLTGVVAGGTNTSIGSTEKGFFARTKNDFNGDGYPDLVWQNVSNGNLAIWLMNGTSVLSELSLGAESDKDWQIAGSGVFNASGYNDLLWHNSSTGQVAVWFMHGTTILSRQVILTQADTDWNIVGTGDFNGDGNTDIVWQNSSTGEFGVWFMNGTTVVSSKIIATESNTNWQIRNK